MRSSVRARAPNSPQGHGEEIAQGVNPVGRFGVDTFDIEQDGGQSVTFVYSPPFKCTGEIDEVVIDLRNRALDP